MFNRIKSLFCGFFLGIDTLEKMRPLYNDPLVYKMAVDVKSPETISRSSIEKVNAPPLSLGGAFTFTIKDSEIVDKILDELRTAKDENAFKKLNERLNNTGSIYIT